MNTLFIALNILFSAQAQMAPEIIAQNKDWTAAKEFSTELNSPICLAATEVSDQTSGAISELKIVKLIKADGTFSSPFLVVTSPSLSTPFYKGSVKINSKPIALSLIQMSAGTKGLISRYADTTPLIAALKAGNAAKVDFLSNTVALSVPFSLSGSNKTIQAFENACR